MFALMLHGIDIEATCWVLESLGATDRAPSLGVVQQGTGYSGYHGAEFVNLEGDHEHTAQAAQQGDACMSDGEVRSSGSADKRPLNKGVDDAQEPEAKRQHVSPDRYFICPSASQQGVLMSCFGEALKEHPCVSLERLKPCTVYSGRLLRRDVKEEEEQGRRSHSGVSRRELRALIRSTQGVQRAESPQAEGCSGSAKGTYCK